MCLLVSRNLPISLVGPESLSCEIGFILFGWSVNQKEKEMIANYLHYQVWVLPGFTHFRCVQHFFFLPGPPNFFISLQLMQLPQSMATHPEHSPQRLTRLVLVPMLVKSKPCKVLASSQAPASFLLLAVFSFTRAWGQG